MPLFFPSQAPERQAENSPYVLDPIDPSDPAYRSLGAANRDLYGWTLRKAQDLSVHLYRSNPLANRIVSIYRSFLAGEGFVMVGHHPEVQAILDEAWTSPRSDLEENHGGYARDGLLFGEAFHPVASDEAGNTTVGFIDPTTVVKVERDSINNMLLRIVHVHRANSAETEPLSIVTVDTDPTSDSAGLYVGETFAWYLERIGSATRGMPFLLPIIDWLDLYDSNLWEMAERVKAMRAHIWDVTVDGDEPEVERMERKWGTAPPRSGSTRFHNKKLDIKAVAPQLGAYEDVAGARYLLRHISTGGGVAPHWLSDPEDANRSTAESMDVPILRGLTDVQSWWQRNMTKLGRYIVDRKVEAGMLDSLLERHGEDGEPLPESVGNPEAARDLVEVVVPEIEGEKVAEAATTLVQVAQAFVQLDLLDAIGKDAQRKIIRNLLPALGVPSAELPEDDPDDQESSDQAMDDFMESAARAGL